MQSLQERPWDHSGTTGKTSVPDSAQTWWQLVTFPALGHGCWEGDGHGGCPRQCSQLGLSSVMLSPVAAALGGMGAASDPRPRTQL